MGCEPHITCPLYCGQMPKSTRAKVDLPEPEWPRITVSEPGQASKLRPFKIGLLRSGEVATKLFTRKTARTSGRPGCFWLARVSPSNSSKRQKAAVALTMPFQVPVSASMGASALDISTFEAIMAPAESSP